MSKLSKREKQKIENQMSVSHRDDTWVGIRPTVFKDKRKDKKSRRSETKNIVKKYYEGR